MGREWRDRQFLGAIIVPSLVILFVRLYGEGGFAPLAWPLQRPGRFWGLVLLWPVMEEAIFRGVLQPFLTGMRWGGLRLAGLTAGNVVTSLLFAAAHLYSHLPYWSALVFIPSLVFGYFRDRHDSLLSPVVLHVTYNLGYFWLLSR